MAQVYNMDTKCLLMFLDAPLQAWGYQSHFDHRKSLQYPTKSGVTGLICAAMGISRDNNDAIMAINLLIMTIYRIRRDDNTSIVPGMMTDYHTVGGGFEKERSNNILNIPRTADGKQGTTVVTWRDYLYDAKFGVTLEGDPKLIDQIGEALLDPVWGTWLGRKSCVPASPIFQGIYDSSEKAMNVFIKDVLKGRYRLIRSVNDMATITKETVDHYTLYDVISNFSERDFSPRFVYEDNFDNK